MILAQIQKENEPEATEEVVEGEVVSDEVVEDSAEDSESAE